jgi:hypothetical protein
MRQILASTLMLSSIILPAAAQSSSTADDATAPTPARVSTGVTAPKLGKDFALTMPDGIDKAFVSTDSQLELSFTVDTQGKAENVKVVKPVNPYWDARVVEEVERSHFKPAKLDNQAIPMEMDLVVNMTK